MSDIFIRIAGSFFLYASSMLAIIASRPYLSARGLGSSMEIVLFVILYEVFVLLTKKQDPEASKDDFGSDSLSWAQPIGQAVWLFSGIAFIARDVSVSSAAKPVFVCSVIIAFTTYWKESYASKISDRRQRVNTKVSPYLSCIIVKHIDVNALMSSLVANQSDDKDSLTRQLLVSSIGKNDWVISFPRCVSIDMFTEIMFDLYLDNAESKSIDMVGYFNSIDGLFGGELTMMRYDIQGEINMVNSSGVNYRMIVTEKRRLLSKSLDASYVPTAEGDLVFEPIDIESTIKHARPFKTIRFEDPYLQM